MADVAHRLVLVIDDEASVREAVTDILELEEMPVITAPDGQHGLELYRDRQTDIGLVLLDLSMPGLNGEQTFHELRKINPQVQVILSSGYSQDEVAQRFADQSRVGFIQKPYEPSKLVREIRRWLGATAVG